jgi:hypothetical protein
LINFWSQTGLAEAGDRKKEKWDKELFQNFMFLCLDKSIDNSVFSQFF